MMTTKEETIKGLEEAYETLENLYDENLDKMAKLQSRIEAIKYNNSSLNRKMKDLAEKIRKIKGE